MAGLELDAIRQRIGFLKTKAKGDFQATGQLFDKTYGELNEVLMSFEREAIQRQLGVSIKQTDSELDAAKKLQTLKKEMETAAVDRKKLEHEAKAEIKKKEEEIEKKKSEHKLKVEAAKKEVEQDLVKEGERKKKRDEAIAKRKQAVEESNAQERQRFREQRRREIAAAKNGKEAKMKLKAERKKAKGRAGKGRMRLEQRVNVFTGKLDKGHGRAIKLPIIKRSKTSHFKGRPLNFANYKGPNKNLKSSVRKFKQNIDLYAKRGSKRRRGGAFGTLTFRQRSPADKLEKRIGLIKSLKGSYAMTPHLKQLLGAGANRKLKIVARAESKNSGPVREASLGEAGVKLSEAVSQAEKEDDKPETFKSAPALKPEGADKVKLGDTITADRDSSPDALYLTPTELDRLVKDQVDQIMKKLKEPKTQV